MKNFKICLIVFILGGLVFQSVAFGSHAMNSLSIPALHKSTLESTTKVMKKNAPICIPQPVIGWDQLKQKISYPKMALRARLEPRVVVRTYITAAGQVADCRMIKGPSGLGFEDAVIDAIKSTAWLPATQGEQAVPVNFDITFSFKVFAE